MAFSTRRLIRTRGDFIKLQKIQERAEQIQKVADSRKPEQIPVLIQELFLDIIQDDENVFIIKRENEFFADVIDTDDPRLFLRVFSEKSLAEEYISETQGLSILEITTIESLQISKISYINGIYGIILNENDSLVAISMSSYLKAFLEGVFKIYDGIDTQYLNCFTLIHGILNNASSHLVCVVQGDNPYTLVKDTEVSYIIENNDDELNNPLAKLVPVNVQTLFFIKTPLKVQFGTHSFVIDNLEYLYAALRILGITQTDAKFTPATGFYSKSKDMDEDHSDYANISDFCLKFLPEDFMDGVIPEPCDTTTLMEIPMPSVPPKKGLHSVKLWFVATFLALQKNIKDFFKKKEDGNETTEKSEEKSENAAQSEKEEEVKEEREANENTSEDSFQKKEKKEKKVKKERNQHSPNEVIRLNPIFLLIFIVIFFFMFSQMFTSTSTPLLGDSNSSSLTSSSTSNSNKQNLQEFGESIDNRDYISGYNIYITTEGDRTAYDQCLVGEADDLLSDYALNHISANDLSRYLAALERFPSQTEIVGDAYIIAGRLELSKNSYVLGINESNIPEKLSHWSHVIQADEKHYQLVRDEVAWNYDEWEGIMISEIERNAYIDRATSLSYAKVASMFFPSNTSIISWNKALSEDSSIPSEKTSISINSLKLIDAPDDSVTIYIKWSNLTNQVIKGVTFTFSFIDELGDVLTNTVNGLPTDCFHGHDINGVYAVGYSTDSDSWGWEGVWSGLGSRIYSIKVASVEVLFEDGSIEQIFLEEDIQKLFS